MFLNLWKRIDYQVITLYRYDKFPNIAKNSIENYLIYLKEVYSLEFKYLSFETIKFNKDNIYSTTSGFRKIGDMGWDEIVSLTLYECDFRKTKVNYSFKLTITNNPSITTLLIPRKIEFDIKKFLLEFESDFRPDYGFNYFTDNGEWCTAYSFPKYFKLSSMEGVSKLSKSDNEEFGKNHREVVNGLFRDVFCINVINEKHLTRNIGQVNLKIYILENSLGKLDFVYNNVYIWALDKEELALARKLIL